MDVSGLELAGTGGLTVAGLSGSEGTDVATINRTDAVIKSITVFQGTAAHMHAAINLRGVDRLNLGIDVFDFGCFGDREFDRQCALDRGVFHRRSERSSDGEREWDVHQRYRLRSVGY